LFFKHFIGIFNAENRGIDCTVWVLTLVAANPPVPDIKELNRENG
jgi:hypothetical protein